MQLHSNRMEFVTPTKELQQPEPAACTTARQWGARCPGRTAVVAADVPWAGRTSATPWTSHGALRGSILLNRIKFY